MLLPVCYDCLRWAQCASEKHLLIVPGADHGMSYCVDTARYENEAKAFWEKYDK